MATEDSVQVSNGRGPDNVESPRRERDAFAVLRTLVTAVVDECHCDDEVRALVLAHFGLDASRNRSG